MLPFVLCGVIVVIVCFAKGGKIISYIFDGITTAMKKGM
jgi:hypothetical protein